MLTLQNFDNQISGSILDRGKQYYKAGAILENYSNCRGKG